MTDRDTTEQRRREAEDAIATVPPPPESWRSWAPGMAERGTLGPVPECDYSRRERVGPRHARDGARNKGPGPHA